RIDAKKERELLLIWGPAPRPPGFFKGIRVYRPMRRKAGHKAEPHAPLSSSDELTGLFLSAVASPQSRPPLHPIHPPYKRPDPAQVYFGSDTTFLLLPVRAGFAFRRVAKDARQQSTGLRHWGVHSRQSFRCFGVWLLRRETTHVCCAN